MPSSRIHRSGSDPRTIEESLPAETEEPLHACDEVHDADVATILDGETLRLDETAEGYRGRRTGTTPGSHV